MAISSAEDTGRDTVVTAAGQTTTVDAIELLKSDHRQVEAWFEQFSATDDAVKKETLTSDICKALEVHTQLEEEIFYPAFLQAGGDPGLHHQAIVEHDSAEGLIDAILTSPGAVDDDYFDARVRVLAEMIRHHVNEEEKPGGLFELAAELELDPGLGAQIERRKIQLMDDAQTERGYDEAVERPDQR